VTDFLLRYPEVQLELHCTGRLVDLVEERFDAGIRAGPLADSSLIARSLGRVRWFLAATPAYLKKHGRPKSPGDLKAHDCLFFGSGSMRMALRFERDGAAPVQVEVPARMLVSDFDILRAATTGGLGIGLLPAFHCADELRARRLERVLRGWSVPPTAIHALYPSTRHLSPTLKRFLEHLQDRMTPPPWELGPV